MNFYNTFLLESKLCDCVGTVKLGDFGHYVCFDYQSFMI